MIGVVNVFPIPNEIPPVEVAYQLRVPALAVAPNTTVPVPHLLFGVVEIIVGIVFTVAKIAVLVEEVHPFSVAST